MKKSINTALLYRRIILLAYDIMAVFLSSVLALVIRYEFVYNSIKKEFLDSIYSFMPVTIVITVVVFTLLKLYSSLWAFANMVELQNLVTACDMTTTLNNIELMLAGKPVPRSFYFIFIFLLTH